MLTFKFFSEGLIGKLELTKEWEFYLKTQQALHAYFTCAKVAFNLLLYLGAFYLV